MTFYENSSVQLVRCRVVLQLPRVRHARLVADTSETRQTILTSLASSWHPRNICYEDATRKLIPCRYIERVKVIDTYERHVEVVGVALWVRRVDTERYAVGEDRHQNEILKRSDTSTLRKLTEILVHGLYSSKLQYIIKQRCFYTLLSMKYIYTCISLNEEQISKTHSVHREKFREKASLSFSSYRNENN